VENGGSIVEMARQSYDRTLCLVTPREKKLYAKTEHNGKTAPEGDQEEEREGGREEATKDLCGAL
jgi:hypothetical protein